MGAVWRLDRCHSAIDLKEAAAFDGRALRLVALGPSARATIPARSARASPARPTRFERVPGASRALLPPPASPWQGRCRGPANRLNEPHAPVAQLDRALPSEGKGHTFESCRVRQSVRYIRTMPQNG